MPLVNLPEKFSDLREFLVYVDSTIMPLLTGEDVFREIVRAIFQHMISDGIVYTEPSFDIRLSRSMNWTEISRVLSEEIIKVSDQLVIVPEIGIPRELSEKMWRPWAEAAYETGIFHGVDLYGDESAKTPKEFLPFFQEVRKKGGTIKIHTGEISGPARIAEDIELTEPDAIQHGIQAVGDPQLLREIAVSNIQVNICPASNIKLSIVSGYEEHPIRRMFDEGVAVTINSDDFGVFGVFVSQDYGELFDRKVFTRHELEIIRENGLRNYAKPANM